MPEAFYFQLPGDESFQSRLDWTCDIGLKQICSKIPNSHVNMDMTLVARYDLGHALDLEKKGEGVAGLTDAPIDLLWRCYSTEALKKKPDGTLGGYNIESMSWKYCNRHDELKQELKGR